VATNIAGDVLDDFLQYFVCSYHAGNMNWIFKARFI